MSNCKGFFNFVCKIYFIIKLDAKIQITMKIINYLFALILCSLSLQAKSKSDDSYFMLNAGSGFARFGIPIYVEIQYRSDYTSYGLEYMQAKTIFDLNPSGLSIHHDDPEYAYFKKNSYSHSITFTFNQHWLRIRNKNKLNYEYYWGGNIHYIFNHPQESWITYVPGIQVGVKYNLFNNICFNAEAGVRHLTTPTIKIGLSYFFIK